MYYKIENFCKTNNISISQMCSDLEIPPQIITNLKNRTKCNPNAGLSAENTMKIAEFMGISVGDLVKKEN